MRPAVFFRLKQPAVARGSRNGSVPFQNAWIMPCPLIVLNSDACIFRPVSEILALLKVLCYGDDTALQPARCPLHWL